MNDLYQEILVKKGKNAKDSSMRFLIITVTAILAVLGVLMMSTILFIGAIVLISLDYYFILPSFDLEYEYTYMNGDIDIDKIMAKRKRKRVASYLKDNLEIMAPTGSDHLSTYLKNAKVKDYTSMDPKVKTWTLVYGADRSADIIRLELSTELAQNMRRYAPRKVFFE